MRVLKTEDCFYVSGGDCADGMGESSGTGTGGVGGAASSGNSGSTADTHDSYADAAFGSSPYGTFGTDSFALSEGTQYAGRWDAVKEAGKAIVNGVISTGIYEAGKSVFTNTPTPTTTTPEPATTPNPTNAPNLNVTPSIPNTAVPSYTISDVFSPGGWPGGWVGSEGGEGNNT